MRGAGSRSGARVPYIYARNRESAEESAERELSLYGTLLYIRRCIRIRVTCTTEHDLSREFIVLGLGRRQRNPRFGSTDRRQRVQSRAGEKYRKRPIHNASIAIDIREFGGNHGSNITEQRTYTQYAPAAKTGFTRSGTPSSKKIRIFEI